MEAMDVSEQAMLVECNVPMKGNEAFIQGFTRDRNPYPNGSIEYFTWDGTWLVFGRELLRQRKCLEHIPINMLPYMLDAYALGLSHWQHGVKLNK